MRTITYILLFIAQIAVAQHIATGKVYEDVNKNGKLDPNEKGLPQVAVSNGREVTLTNSQGDYSISVGNDNIIFVIKPRGFALPLQKTNIPDFYYVHKPNGTPKAFKKEIFAPTGDLPAAINFGLFPSPEKDSFKVIVFGDPQPYNEKQLEYFDRSIVQEVKNIKDASFGISLGDIVGDNLPLLSKYKEVMRQIPLPWYNVMGNHDMNYEAKADSLSDETFEKEFGPVNYAWNHGDAHFINLDNIYYPDPREGRGYWASYWGGFRPDQLDFLKNDLALVDKNKLIVISMHIPIYKNEGKTFRPEDRKAFFDILKPFKNILLLTAHTHMQEQMYHGKEVGYEGENEIHEFNVGTTSGDWYSGEKDGIGVPYGTMRDGTPRGYAILHINGNKYTSEYKVYNQPKDYQMEIYMPKVIPHKNRTSANLMVNFFMGGIGDKVDYKIDDNKFQPMYKSEFIDWNYAKSVMKWDDTEELMEGRRPSNPSISSHIWSIRLPGNLEVGEHTVTIEATDRYGNTFTESKNFRVAEDVIIP